MNKYINKYTQFMHTMGRKSNTTVSLEQKHFDIAENHELNLSKFLRGKLEELENEK